MPPHACLQAASGSGVNLLQYERQVHRHQDRVYGFARYLLGDPEEARDVTQEVLLRLWHHREAVEEDRLTGWLLRVTRNACIDALRKRRTYQDLVRADAERVGQAASRTPDPEAATEAALFREALERALRQLPEPQRSIVILREIQDCTYEQISEALALPLNTVKVYLHRARKALRNQLREEWHREAV